MFKDLYFADPEYFILVIIIIYSKLQRVSRWMLDVADDTINGGRMTGTLISI